MIDIISKRLDAIKLKNIAITDKFWRRYTDLVPDVILPYQWEILNDRIDGAEPSYCLRNYKIAAGEEKGQHSGVVFVDTDVAKWLEAVAFSLETNPDGKLKQRADEVIELIGRAQQSDGYLNTYFTIAEPDKRWSNLTEAHELYSAGHLIEAAVAYYEATGKDKLLNIVIRFADLICQVFGTGDGQINGYCGHQEIELALIKLYYTTGYKRYLDLAMYFINQRGTTPNYFIEEIKRNNRNFIFDEFKNYDPAYSQSHMPPRQQTTAEGHAVRAMYMYSAMADLAYEYGDSELMQACKVLWENIVTKRMYLTGSIGSSAFLERFTTDYDLPNDVNYSETCASIGLAMFGSRMSRIKRDATYFDVVETALYNTVLAAIALEGNTYFYVNPLEVWPQNCMEHTSKKHVKPVRQKWFNVACCPTNIARTLASLGKYIISLDENSMYFNLFIANKAKTDIKGVHIETELQTSFLYDGKSNLIVNVSESVEFAVNIRIPKYVHSYSIKVNGDSSDALPLKNGYAEILREWKGTSVIEIVFDIKAEFVAAHPEVRADAGKVAIVKGPIVYCLEENDNGKNLPSIVVDPATPLSEHFESNLFGGTMVVKFHGRKITNSGWGNELYKTAGFTTEPVKLTAIPYCLWGNRGKNEMLVWLKASV